MAWPGLTLREKEWGRHSPLLHAARQNMENGEIFRSRTLEKLKLGQKYNKKPHMFSAPPPKKDLSAAVTVFSFSLLLGLGASSSQDMLAGSPVVVASILLDASLVLGVSRAQVASPDTWRFLNINLSIPNSCSYATEGLKWVNQKKNGPICR